MLRNLSSLIVFYFLLCQAFGQSKEYISFDPSQVLQKSSTLEDISVYLPLGQGSLKLLKATAHTLIKGDLSQNYPNHKNYKVKSVDGKASSGYLLISPTGVFLSLNTDLGYLSLSPTHLKNKYILEKGFEHSKSAKMACAAAAFKSKLDTTIKGLVINNGDFIRQYDLALAITGEYYAANGNNDNDVMSWVMYSVNGLNAIFEREMAINFNLGDRVVLYNNFGNDPFISNPNEDNRTVQAGNAIQANFDINSYDLGHVYHNTNNNPVWRKGGVARLEVLCEDQSFNGSPVKAQGWSSADTNQENNWIQLMTHEFAHMLGAHHTFNGSGEACNGGISNGHAYEIGSGSTLMSYQGLCSSNQNIPSLGESDNYFHIDNLISMQNYLLGFATCYVPININNNIPTVQVSPCAVDQYTVPKDTPFKLEGAAQDQDNDPLTYCWEQLDEDGPNKITQGSVGEQAAINTAGPVFRSFPPSTSSTRFFPNLEIIASGNSDPFQVLPKVARSLNFQLTVRDNHPTGGAFASENLQMQVSNVGPLEITSPSASDDIFEGTSFNIVWNPNGSQSLCSVVDISMSLDGGKNFNIPIANFIPYSAQSFNYVIPVGTQNSDQAIVKVECADHTCFSFFNLSSMFKVSSSCEGNYSLLCDDQAISVNQGSPALNLNLNASIGREINTVDLNVLLSNPLAYFARKGSNGACETLTFASGNPVVTPHQFVEFEVTTSGSYNISKLGESFQVYTIFTAENFDLANPCPNFIDSNATEDPNNPGTTSTFVTNEFNVQLEGCKKYLLAGTIFNQASLITVNFFGPGQILQTETLSPNTAYTYTAINTNSQRIDAVSATADFGSLGGGSYTIEGAQYQSTDLPSSWIGFSKSDLSTQGKCVVFSSNGKPITIIGQIADNDGDGYNADIDCDDNNAAINPAQVEIPNNNIDEDCDGIALVIDNDGDGYNSDDDCDDNNAAINPSQIEVANNNIDEDCNGEALFIDNDMDGYHSDIDCDDNNASINAGQAEIPNNNVDEDCDGIALIIDNDMDGYHSDIDCDDNNASINAGQAEIPNNNIDEDCDGIALIIDNDMDGYHSDIDCDDNDASINAGQIEIPNNDVDEDCDGIALVIDNDMDGYHSDIDCDDDDANINAGQDEIPNNDIDEDCDGIALIIDEDNDGFNSDEDCDDTNPNINPAAEEISNNQIDEDCNGEDLITFVFEIDEAQVKVFPNPSYSLLWITLDQMKKLNLRLFDLQGKTLIEQIEIESDAIQLDLSEFPAGTYILELQSNGSDISIFERIVKLN